MGISFWKGFAVPVYLILYLVLFWAPVVVLAVLQWKYFDPPTKKAFWVTMAVMTVATTVMEFIFVGLDVWSFSEKKDPLLGIWFGKVPIEEFVFWYGASPLFFFTYVSFDRLFSKKAR